MNKPFDMELFITGVLKGSNASRQRHIRQAKVIQTAISKRWQRDNPWKWQKKYLIWFLTHRINHRSESTRYYYWLTAKLIDLRLAKSWFKNNKYRELRGEA